jgi:hypothetical protein
MKIKNVITTLLVVFFISKIFAQDLPDKYYVQFTDKNNSPYSLDHPEEYLSDRAIKRRVKQNIPIDKSDIPVNLQYLEGVKNAGAQILFPTKWLNGVTIIAANQQIVNTISQLPYVSDVKLVTYESYKSKGNNKKSFFEAEAFDYEKKLKGSTSIMHDSEYDYGQAYDQINLINGIPLHEMGYRGEGMVIAVLDAGFNNVPTQPLFDSLWANGQILGTKDFVTPGGDVFTLHTHGRKVLSTMAANISGLMIGTAPKASYWLLRPENPVQEYIAEEYNWVSAAEFADSVGADVINSSLGYIYFNNPAQDHTYDETDGNTAIVTIGADKAASKGIIVCNSAGNEGDNEWQHIGFPADGDSVFTIGAVDNDGYYASFSSTGPTADGRIKPNVVATGLGTTLADGYDSVTFGSGTSYSSPITAGMVACLWQALPDKNNMEVINSVMQSASQNENPDNLIGWGIPDYEVALSILTSIDSNEQQNGIISSVYPNPFDEKLILKFNHYYFDNIKICVYNINGKLVYQNYFYSPGFMLIMNKELSNLKNGCYLINISTKDDTQSIKIIKQ